MEPIRTFNKLYGRTLFLGMFLILLLQGCSTNVEVKCGTGSGGQPEKSSEECGKKDLGACIGACSTKVVTSPIDANEYSNHNAWNMVTNTRITDHTRICNSGSKCNQNAGSKMCSGVNKTCMTKWSNGSCTCGCPP